jgi:hypothetical protein
MVDSSVEGWDINLALSLVRQTVESKESLLVEKKVDSKVDTKDNLAVDLLVEKKVPYWVDDWVENLADLKEHLQAEQKVALKELSLASY